MKLLVVGESGLGKVNTVQRNLTYMWPSGVN